MATCAISHNETENYRRWCSSFRPSPFSSAWYQCNV